jgi:glycosyltransferase involved in cell wall biosynthesis
MGQVAYEITKNLRARGEDVTLVAPKRRVNSHQPDESWIVRLPSWFRWGNGSILKGLDPMIRNTDVVHLHYPFFGTAEAVAQSCLLHRKPLFTTFHMDATASFPLGMIFAGFRFASQPAILLASQRVFVSSMDYASRSSMAGYTNAHPDRIIENPFGVDSMFVSGAGDRKRFGIPEDAFVVGFTASMDHQHRFKGIEILLEAMTMLPNVHALFVGDGDRRRVYESWANDKKIGDRCHFVGHLTRTDLPIAYRTMDVFTFPSIGKAEAFGLVCAEALACGVPVIASDLAGVRTVVRNDETGLIIPPHNAKILSGAIDRLRQSANLRKQLSERAEKDAHLRFDWNRHTDILMKAYLRKI